MSAPDPTVSLEWFERIALRRETALDAAMRDGERALRVPGGWPTCPVMLLVHRDCANLGGWRVTRFDATGEVAEGHTEHADYRAALRETLTWCGRLAEATEMGGVL